METLSSNNLICLTNALEDSYFGLPRVQHIGSGFLPSRDEIYQLLQRFFSILYPGFFGRQSLARDNIRQFIATELQDLSNSLYREIYQSLALKNGSLGNSGYEAQAKEMTETFLNMLPNLRELLATDILAAYQGDPAAQDTNEIIFSYPSTIALTTHRLAHELWKMNVPLMPRIMSERAHSMTGIDIHPGATIGRSFFIDHGTGVVIGETTIIGERCKLYQGVTLGALSFPHDDTGQIIRNYKRHPTLEDEVVVYSNASILGDVTIGRGCTIGGGVFLTQSVPPGCTVSSKPAELKYRNRPDRTSRGRTSDYQI